MPMVTGGITCALKPARVAGLILEATHFLEHGMLRTEVKTFFRKCKFLQILATAGKRGRYKM